MMTRSRKLKAPFPYFGGKGRVAGEVWKRFGAVKTYVEPFFGSGAVLLGRPGGYGNQGSKESRGKRNRHREVIWFSPACISAPTLFDFAAGKEDL